MDHYLTERVWDAMDEARKLAARSTQPLSTLDAVRRHLRIKRKYFLGTHISLEQVVSPKGEIDYSLANDLSNYLAQKASALWNFPPKGSLDFCTQFFSLAISAVASGGVGNESIDDIIQLAECLVRDRETFTIVMKPLIPEDRVAELYAFVDDYESDYFLPTFEDAVMGAVAVFMGALEDPDEAKKEGNK
ncbi:MAG: hypothetical protein IJP35_03755 [Clostridia bacterium]|nr:hypothetical protein [Clostridia bacterium]